MSTSLTTKSRKRGYKPGNITAQQHVFIKALQADPNMGPKEAATIAGYKHPAAMGTKLLKKPHINAELSKQLTKRLDRLELDGDRVVQEVAYAALRDPIDLCDEDGFIITDDLSKIPERMRRCIDGLEVIERTTKEGEIIRTIKIKLVGKLGALDMCMKHFGMYEKDNEQNTTQVNWDQLVDLNTAPKNITTVE